VKTSTNIPPHIPLDPALLPPEILLVCRRLLDAGGRAWLVGGCVRDLMLGMIPEDYDLEVYGLQETALTSTLQQIGRCEMVGKQFGVHKLWLKGMEIDLALPRTETKTGSGHCGFAVQVDPDLSPATASLRRDFTINAMMFDPLADTLLDLHGGSADLASRVLRHVSQAFVEDPLRPLRAMQFAARFGLTLAEETAALCRQLLNEAGSLPASRIWTEWRKWSHAPYPSCGLRVLQQSGWLACYAELDALQDCPQDPHWHPEGDVWLHTQQVVDQAAAIAHKNRLDHHTTEQLVFAALCHDLGKTETTRQTENGRIASPGHHQAGLALSQQLLSRMHAPARLITFILPLVQEHMTHLHGKPTPRAVRRLAWRLQPSHIELWEMLVEADASGRAPAPPSRPALAWLEMAQSLQQHRQPAARIVDGNLLMELGIEPGPGMGALLAQAYQAQLNGDFDDIESGRRWCIAHIGK